MHNHSTVTNVGTARTLAASLSLELCLPCSVSTISAILRRSHCRHTNRDMSRRFSIIHSMGIVTHSPPQERAANISCTLRSGRCPCASCAIEGPDRPRRCRSRRLWRVEGIYAPLCPASEVSNKAIHRGTGRGGGGTCMPPMARCIVLSPSHRYLAGRPSRRTYSSQ